MSQRKPFFEFDPQFKLLLSGAPAFATGLPGELQVAEPPDAGVAVLGRIRALARREADALAPSCSARWDGAERIAADPEAIALKATYDAVVTLIDCISADPAMRLKLGAVLARGER